jgi:hypothetical protein
MPPTPYLVSQLRSNLLVHFTVRVSALAWKFGRERHRLLLTELTMEISKANQIGNIPTSGGNLQRGSLKLGRGGRQSIAFLGLARTLNFNLGLLGSPLIV